MSSLAHVQASTAQVLLPKTASDVPGPVSGNKMLDAYVQLVGRMADSGGTRW